MELVIKVSKCAESSCDAALLLDMLDKDIRYMAKTGQEASAAHLNCRVLLKINAYPKLDGKGACIAANNENNSARLGLLYAEFVLLAVSYVKRNALLFMSSCVFLHMKIEKLTMFTIIKLENF